MERCPLGLLLVSSLMWMRPARRSTSSGQRTWRISLGRAPVASSRRTIARSRGPSLVLLAAAITVGTTAVAGHDRGGRVAHRLALDHGAQVERLAVLDIIPTGEVLRRLDRDVFLDFWHWAFLAQPYDLPERLICPDPDRFYFRGDRHVFDERAFADYRRAYSDPQTVHAMCEDYRAGATLDADADEADRSSGRRITAPVLALWSARGSLAGRDALGSGATGLRV